ncbi:MAG: HD domain-containing phosphohydrolase [Planctomycetota bacterium]
MSHSEQVQVRSLCVGQPLMTDLTDSSGVLLLRAGVVITQGFIDTLTRRGISTVSTRESDEIRAAREEAEAAAAKNAEKTKPSKSPAVSNRPAPSAASSTPALDAVQPDGSFATDLSYDPGRAPAKKLSVAELHALSAQTERAFDRALDQYAGLGPALADAQVTDLGLASDLLRGFQRYVGADPALVLMLMKVKGDAQSSLYRHGIKTALLSMTLATQMGFADQQVTDAGVAALVHDLGMLRVPLHIRTAERQLTPAEWQQVREHPTHTLNILDRLKGVTESVKTAAYQVHERCDASGYPRKRPQQFIHPMAKVIAVADTYAALTDDRPHRASATGHEAMKTILREVKQGKHDRSVVRALLDTMSMFPVGTHVSLSDGRNARVLRGVPGHPIQPVVVVLQDGKPADWELDLAQVGDLSITQVLPEDAAIAA